MRLPKKPSDLKRNGELNQSQLATPVTVIAAAAMPSRHGTALVCVQNRSPLYGASSAAGAVSAVTASGLAYVATHDPHLAGSYPACTLYSLTGLYCPACGGTRAGYDLLHGDLAGSFARNPAVPLLVLGAVAWLVYRVVARRHPDRSPRPMQTWLPVVVGLATLVFGVLRNVPGWDWLSPA